MVSTPGSARIVVSGVAFQAPGDVTDGLPGIRVVESRRNP